MSWFSKRWEVVVVSRSVMPGPNVLFGMDDDTTIESYAVSRRTWKKPKIGFFERQAVMGVGLGRSDIFVRPISENPYPDRKLYTLFICGGITITSEEWTDLMKHKLDGLDRRIEENMKEIERRQDEQLALDMEELNHDASP